MRQFLTTALTFFVLMLAGTAHAGDCMRLCDHGFWDSNLSLDDIRAEIAKGADPLNGNSISETPLHIAASRGTSEHVQFLIDQGANIDARTSGSVSRTGGRVPLQYAVVKPNNLYVLIQAGANINTKDGSGDTPLHWAVSSVKWHKSANLLLDAGAVATVKDKDGQTPFDLIRGDTDWLQQYSTYKRLKAASGQ